MGISTTDRARTQRAKDVENALASGRLEGLAPSPEAMEIFQRYIEGALTLEQVGAAIDAHADRVYRSIRPPRNEC